MKIVLIVCLVGLSIADVPASSYSSLPYETEGHSGGYHSNSIQGGHGYSRPQVHYGYPSAKSKGKFGLDFKKIVNTPIQLVKGAGDYVHEIIGDIKGKYLRLKGSLARAKGNLLAGLGEDLIRKASSFGGLRKKPVSYYHAYAPPKPVYGAPKPVYGAPKPVYGAPKPVYGAPQQSFDAPSYTYGAPTHSHGGHTHSHGGPSHGHDGPNHAHAVPSHSHDAHIQSHGAPVTSFNGDSQVFSAPAVHHHAKTNEQIITSSQDFGVPKESDVFISHAEHHHSVSSDPAHLTSDHSTNSIDQEYGLPTFDLDHSASTFQARSQANGRADHFNDFAPSAHSQREYYADPNPIPVPFPVAISPMKLVFPQLPH